MGTKLDFSTAYHT
jgi:hypothetical protein